MEKSHLGRVAVVSALILAAAVAYVLNSIANEPTPKAITKAPAVIVATATPIPPAPTMIPEPTQVATPSATPKLKPSKSPSPTP